MADEKPKEDKGMLLSDEQIQALRAKGSVMEVDREGVTYVFRKPSKLEYAQFMDTAANPGRKSVFAAQENIVVNCVMHPSREYLAAMIDEFPGLVTMFFADVVAAAGLDDQALVKKR